MPTTLTAGDIAFSAFQGDNTGGGFNGDAFQFVLLVPVEIGTTLYFTDGGYRTDTGTFRTNENMVRWVAQANLAAGTVITFTAPGGAGAANTAEWTGILPSSGNTAAAATLALAVGGDNITALFNPTFGGSEALTGTAIAQITFGGGSFAGSWTNSSGNAHTALAPGLTDGVNALSLAAIDNGRYDQSRSGSIEVGSLAEIRAALNNEAYWDTNTLPLTPVHNTTATFGPGLATIVDGAGDPDTLSNASPGATINGLDGDDILSGGGGNQTLDGGSGTDTADYSAAAAGVIVRLNRGDAFDDGDGGVDTLISMEDATGSAFVDILIGEAGANTLSGGAGADTLLGLEGNDTLVGGSGAANNLYGGLGDDTYEVSANDTIVELVGQGFDEVRTSNASLTLAANIEALTYTGGGAFTGVGNALGNFMRGGAGDDVLSGRGGDDTFLGEGGSDTVDYGLAASAVTAFLDSSTASDGDGGTDGFQSIENLRGSAFGDVLYGDAFANILDGGAGDDTLTGRGGNDTLRGGSGIDTADYSDATAAVAVRLNGGTASDGEGGSDIVIAVENVNGGDHNDLLIGSTLDNSLNGALGRDTLVGLEGNDTLRGGAGVANELIGGLGDDTYIVDANDTTFELVGEGTDTVQTTRNTYTLAANVENLAFSGAGDFTGTGNADANAVTGGSGADFLRGNGGNDTLNGGSGVDTAVMTGASFEYTIENLGGGQYRITDNVGARDGIDILNGMEEVTFANGITAILGGAPAPVLSDKDADGPQVLPGFAGDDFLIGKDMDLPLVLPGVADVDTPPAFLDRAAPPDQRPGHMLTLDHDGFLLDGIDGPGRLHDPDGWLF